MPRSRHLVSGLKSPHQGLSREAVVAQRGTLKIMMNLLPLALFMDQSVPKATGKSNGIIHLHTEVVSNI